MTKETIEICNRVWEQIKTERFNERMSYISRIFNYHKFLEVDVSELKKNPYYYNDTFDRLYDLPLEDLESVDQMVSSCVSLYNETKK